MNCEEQVARIAGARNELLERMARPLRIEASGLTYHVHARGNGRMPIFIDDVDHQHFLDNLAKILPEERVACFAFCVMSTHYHVVIRPELPNLSHAMRQVNGIYAQWWNKRHQHVGHVFQARFTAHVIESSLYLLQACRYVVNNPVDAHIVRHASEYRWSSYRATAGLESPPRFLDVETIRQQLGGLNSAEAFARLIEEPPSETFLKLMNAGRSVVADDRFVEKFRSEVEKKRGLNAADRRLGRPTLDVILSGNPSRAALGARIAEAHDRYRYSLREIADYLGATTSWTGKLLKAARGTPSCSAQVVPG